VIYLGHEEREVAKGTKGCEFDDLSRRVIGCAIDVHSILGAGMLESVYERCLSHELRSAGLHCESQKKLPVTYKGIELDEAYRLDLLVEGSLIIELKSVNGLLESHEAQLLSYMKLSQISVGLLINFNVKQLKHGIKRFVL